MKDVKSNKKKDPQAHNTVLLAAVNLNRYYIDCFKIITTVIYSLVLCQINRVKQHPFSVSIK